MLNFAHEASDFCTYKLKAMVYLINEGIFLAQHNSKFRSGNSIRLFHILLINIKTLVLNKNK